MTNANVVLGELAVASGSSFAICTSVNAEPLLTALITLGTTIVTMVGGELVKFLIAFLKNKTNKYENKKEGEKENENKN